MQTWRSSGFMFLGLIGIHGFTHDCLLRGGARARWLMAQDLPSTVPNRSRGSMPQKSNGTLICDQSKRPRIAKVEPDEAKPGDKVVITGENFGTKECFHTVTFSAASNTARGLQIHERLDD